MSYITRGQAIKTNFSANGQILALDVSQLNLIRFEFSGTYTLTGTFETSTDSTNGTDGTWFPLQAVMTSAATTALSHATANATQAYEASVAGVLWVRIRLTAFTSAAAHRIAIFGVDTAVEPLPVSVLASSSAGIGSVVISSLPTGTAISVTTAASTNASIQKSTAGNLFDLSISNPTATAISVKLYNKATAPTVGTDVPVVTQTVAPGATVPLTFGNIGRRFATGIAMAATALPAATDTGVAVAGVQINGTYI